MGVAVAVSACMSCGRPAAPSGATAAGVDGPHESGADERPLPPGPAWRQAADLDPMHLSRLARAEGARALIQRAESGGRTAWIAIAALAYSEEPEAALRYLCGSLSADDNSQPKLLALHSLVAAPPADREASDPEVYRQCAGHLRAYATAGLSPELADLVASSQRMLSEHSPSRGEASLGATRRNLRK